MFKPNLTCKLYISSGKTDVYGQPTPSTAVLERCAVVKLNIASEKSSVRADSSASRGAALELTTISVILLEKITKASIDDVLEIDGHKLRITGIAAQRSIQGVLDHYRIQAHFWSTK